jgi:hypothetical protein
MGAFYPVFEATGITRTIEVHDLGEAYTRTGGRQGVTGEFFEQAPGERSQAEVGGPASE